MNFYKYHNIHDFAKRSFYSKQNDLTEFKDILDLFYYDTEKIKPNNEAQEKALEKRKIMINTASKLYDKLLNIYTTHFHKLSEDLKKRVNVLNKPETLKFDFGKDDLPQMPPLEDDEEVKLEPAEVNAERIKLNPRKRKTKETGLKI